VKELELTIPLLPPSVNHYKQPYINRLRRIAYFVTPEAKAFKAAVATIAAGRTIAPETGYHKVRYELRVRIVLGKGQRGDGDNFMKCIADGLQEAGVIHSDARVKTWHTDLDDQDRSNPRTEIFVRVIPAEEEE
jgi:Holliday junction resolvase RusA-like endonuclease